MTIRLADRIGIEKILSTVKRFQDWWLYRWETFYVFWGSGLVTLVDLTNAYGMIVNGGKEINPTMIKSIYSKEGYKILHNEIKSCQNCKLDSIASDTPLPNILIDQREVLDPRIAYQITSMLEGVVIRGTAKKYRN